MQIQILIDTDKDDPNYTARVLRAVISRHQSDPDEYIATREAFERVAAREALYDAAEAATDSAPAAPAKPIPSALQAPAEQAEALAAGADPTKTTDALRDFGAAASAVAAAKRRGRPRKLVNEANAEPAVPIAPADQSAQTAAVASDATPPAGAAGEASQPFTPPLGPSFNADGTPAGKTPEVEPPATPEYLLEQVFNKYGPAKAIECLQRFGVMRLRELKPEQRPEFVEYLRDVLAGRSDPAAGAQ